MNQKSKILLTGHTGFLGKILSRELSTRGYQVQGLLDDKGVKVDIAQPFELSNLISDVVIHCAGKAHSVPKNDQEVQAFYDINETGTRNLCAALERLPMLPSALIFISTIAVYGLDEGTGIPETHPLNGKSPYAKSKIQAEIYLKEWAKKNKVTLGMLRLPLVVGPDPPGNLGAMIKGIKSGKYRSIGGGKARKSMVWAEDIAGIIPQLATLGGIYNLTDDYHPSFSELEQAIASTLHIHPPKSISLRLARLLGKVGDLLGPASPVNSDKIQKITATLTFDDAHARLKLGWTPTSVLPKIATIL